MNAVARPPCDTIDSTVLAAVAASRSTIAMLAPSSSASRSAILAPIAPPAPVTSATRDACGKADAVDNASLGSVQRCGRAIFSLFRRLRMHYVTCRVRKHRRAAVIAELERKAMRVGDRAIQSERFKRLVDFFHRLFFVVAEQRPYDAFDDVVVADSSWQVRSALRLRNCRLDPRKRRTPPSARSA